MKHLEDDIVNKPSDQQPLSAVNRIPSSQEGIFSSFGKQLNALLYKKHFRNKKLADRAGICPNLIAQYRRGKASCSPARANLLAQYLDCTEAERISLCRAAALTTKDPIGESVQAMLILQGIDTDSITCVAPSATNNNQISIATRDGRVITLTISIKKQ